MRNMNLVTLALIILGGLNFLSMGVTGYDVIGTVSGRHAGSPCLSDHRPCSHMQLRLQSLRLGSRCRAYPSSSVTEDVGGGKIRRPTSRKARSGGRHQVPKNLKHSHAPQSQELAGKRSRTRRTGATQIYHWHQRTDRPLRLIAGRLSRSKFQM